MKKVAWITLASLALLVGFAAPSHAHGGHFRGGVFIGPIWGPGWWGPAYPYPYPYYPPQPTTVIRQEPQEYLEAEPQVQQQAWYYCPDPQGYYPYVKQCPRGWQKVTPTPTPAPAEPQPESELLEP